MYVSIVAWLMYARSKKLGLAPVACALTGAHRDCPFLFSDARQLETQHLVCRS